MKKFLSILLTLAMCAGVFAGCGSDGVIRGVSLGEVIEYASLAERLEAYGLDENRRFIEPRSITVEVFDRENAANGGTDPTNNAYTDWIKEGLLRDHNIIVEFVRVHRWTEADVIVNLLAAGSAPDVCYSYNINAVNTYGRMDAIWDLNPFMHNSEELFPNIWETLGRTNIFQNQDPQTNHLWMLEGMNYGGLRLNTFVREDWLEALGMDAPTSEAEFEAMLIAFRDNAELLLGSDADQMVPFNLAQDVGWQAGLLIESYIPNDITDREWYITDFHDRRMFRTGVKEAIRVLNRWYNDGLIDPDFALYGPGNDTPEDRKKAGFVGAFIHNWDYPYRGGEQGITAELHRNVGEHANFIAVDTFLNDAGLHRKFLPTTTADRKIFLPSTNTEPVASLLYVDWISRPEVILYLQTGEEGLTHEIMDNGAIRIIPAPAHDPMFMNSPRNIDYTIGYNGNGFINIDDQRVKTLSLALGYAEVPPRLIEAAFAAGTNDGRTTKAVNVGIIESEDGLSNTLRDRMEALWATSIVASPEDFDSVYDAAMDNIMINIGNASIAERTEKFAEFYGDVDWLP
ncbi:MAG: sugar ABC transporter substrate-binding protein [Defluviitaleaceae bacterium]|nr:sugar ABC transporter substrate-binding protein [Defluviitaleaceae bacterium]MCL2835806.1 sugar ABC transporter substrate-binding protein [Defluviitaleaceae bacterium]